MSKVFRVIPNVLFKICPILFSEPLFELITVKFFSYIQKKLWYKREELSIAQRVHPLITVKRVINKEYLKKNNKKTIGINIW